jgi:ABC-type oligopeptide transport system substrate-binding subunit/class 3 adenylate cyclase/tetratricopeptide (TPR) repeat protein
MKNQYTDDRLPEGTVTFLFTDIEGSTELLKALGDIYAELLSQQRDLLRDIFNRWGGQEVDTQGDSFFVSFPRATQAVSAAVEIQQTLKEQAWPGGVELRLRMGLHTGEPLTWAEGYVGIDVHRAARIAHVGHGGQVLLSATTTPLVLDDLPEGVSTLDLGRHRMKDMRRPERIHQLVIGGLPSEFPPLKSLEALPPEVTIGLGSVKLPAFLEDVEEIPAPVFVGRDRELALLEGFLDQAVEGRGQVVFLTGGPGRGKTVLLNAFARGAMERHPDLLVVSGECSAYTGVGDPYHPFRGVMGMLTGDLETKWAAGRLTRQQALRLWEGMPRVSHALVEQGQDLIDVFVSGRELLARVRSALEGSADWLERLATLAERERPLPGELEQRNLFEQVEDVFAEIAEEHPLLILLDDLQWSDKASINLLFHLGRRLLGRRILIVGAYRPEEITLGRGDEKHPLEPVLAEFKRLHGDIWIDLSAITKDEEQQFIKAYLDSEPNRLSDGFRQALYDHTDGHPLFTVELLRDLQERGDLVKDDEGVWIEGPELDWGVLPARVEGVIEERIGRLKEELRETLTIASVEGEDFTSQVVAGVQQVGERKLLKRLSRELEKQHRLVRARGELKVGTNILSQFQFSHVLLQRFLYNDLGAGERRLLHGEIAGALEDLYGSENDSIAVQLAYHYANAQEADKAIHYLQLAGDKARLAYAHQEAIDYYQRALALQKEQGYENEAARTLMKLGLTYHTAFDFEQARQAYEQGFVLWQRVGSMEPTLPPPPAPHALRLNFPVIMTLDPNLCIDSWSEGVIIHLFSGMVDRNPEMDIVPDIARSWEVSAGGRKYIFHMRDDVRWSDGTAVTAMDFEYAWKRALDPATESPTASMLYVVKGARAYHKGETSDAENVGVRALDDLTLSVELEKPTGHFLHLMVHSGTYPIPRHVVEAHGKEWTDVDKIVTNGPFLLETWQRDEPMVLSRDPDYHSRFSGNLQSVELHFQKEQSDFSTQLELYEADRLDIYGIYAMVPDVIDRARQRNTGDYVLLPSLAIYLFGFNVLKSPFNDIRVRQAFALATDREKLSNVVLGGGVFPATGGVVPPGMPGHSAGIALPYDPESARKLLAEAGYPDGRDFPKIHCLAPTPVDAIKEYLLAQWRDNLGVEIEWESTEWTEFVERIHSEEMPDICWHGWVANYPDPDTFLCESLTMGIKKWQNEHFYILLEKAKRITDQNKRMKLYKQADKILVEEAAVMPLHYGKMHIFVKPWVSKYPTSAIRIFHWKDVILEPH